MSDRDQFHRAARDGYLDLLKEATRKDCNTPDEDGMTPTLYAAHCGNLEALRVLVGRGGDPDKCDHYGNTALHCAAANGHLGCVSFLVSFDCNLFAMDNDFHTAKEVAAINQKEEVLRFLDGMIAKISTDKSKHVEKLKDKATKDAEKRIKNFSKLQKKATKKAEKDEKVLEKQRQKMVVTDSKSTVQPGRPLDPNNSRKDSRLLYVSPKFSDIVNTSSSHKKGLGAVSKKIQLKKQDSSTSEFKVRDMEGTGKKSVRSLSGLRRDSEIMYVPKDDSKDLLQNRRHMKDVFDSNSNVSKAASEPSTMVRNKNDAPIDLYEDGERLTVPQPSSIFERPGFGSVAFRNSISTTLLSLPSLEQDAEDEEDFDDANDSIGSASSLKRRSQANLPWNEEDLNMDDQDDGEDVSPLILFFAAHGLIEYVPLFTQEKIDLDALMLLNEEDLKDLGLQLGPRKKLMKAIEIRKAALQDPGEVADSQL